MKFGRIGVVSSLSRKKRREQYRSGKSGEIELTDKDMTSIEQVLDSDERILQIYNVPVLVWSVGVLIIIVGLYLLYNLIWGFEGKVFNTNTAKGWQYIVAILITTLGIAFIFAVRREKLVFDKANDSISITLKNIVCRQTVRVKKLSQCSNIKIVKRGVDTFNTNSIHYKLVLTFQDGEYFEVLEGKKESKIRTQLLQIYVYMNLPLEIIIHDETG